MKLTMMHYLITLIALCLSVVSFASETPWDGINTSGFSGLAGGVLSHLNQEVQPTSNGLGVYGYYWSSSQHSNFANAWARQLNTGASDIYRVGSFRLYGLSVRCLKDN